MKKLDLNYKLILIPALITMISVTLPAYLYMRGLPWSWTLALLAGFISAAILGIMLGRRLD
jgi:hypothetical protein